MFQSEFPRSQTPLHCVSFCPLQGLSAGVGTCSVDCIAMWTSIIVALTIRHLDGKNWRKNTPKSWQPKSRNFSTKFSFTFAYTVI